jgi:hypothetical protein
MKKIFAIILIICSFSFSQSDNVDTTLATQKYYNGTMTAAIDTIDIAFSAQNAKQYEYYTVTATSSVTDTIEVWTQSWYNSLWSQVAMSIYRN